MNEDSELLRRYEKEGVESAFTKLVERHLPLVYHAALRRVGGDVTLAEEATQKVFIALANKAAALSDRNVLTGWLYTSACLAAADLLRREKRRLTREQAAFNMQQIDQPAENPDWHRITPVIHEVLTELGEKDRSAILLRFFEEKNFAEIGRAFQITEDGARLRISRALDKLNASLSRRGIKSTSALMASALAVQQAGAVPVGLAASVSAAALTAAAGQVTWFAAIHWITMNKLQNGIIATVVAAGLTASLVELRANRILTAELANLQTTSEPIKSVPPASTSGMHADAEELQRLRRRSAQLQSRPSGVVDSAMKPISSCAYRGNATSEAAVESLFWAASTDDLTTLSRLSFFDEKWDPLLNSWFATLSEPVRTKYVTPQRLLVSKFAGMFSTKGFSEQKGEEPSVTTAYQIVDQRDVFNNRTVEYWAAGTGTAQHNWEFSGLIQLHHDGEGWRYDANRSSEAEWKKVLSFVDPATGNWQLPLYGIYLPFAQ